MRLFAATVQEETEGEPANSSSRPMENGSSQGSLLKVASMAYPMTMSELKINSATD